MSIDSLSHEKYYIVEASASECGKEHGECAYVSKPTEMASDSSSNQVELENEKIRVTIRPG